jgi:biopolymer transport protein TolR
MVPFIDVMLVLLIIFMVTAPLITPGAIDLPSVGKAGRQPDQIIQIIITKHDAIELRIKNQTTLMRSGEELTAAVKKAQSDSLGLAVLISADRTIQYESVVKIMDNLQRAGVKRVGLSVQLVN